MTYPTFGTHLDLAMAYIPIELHLALIIAHTLFKTFLTLAMVYVGIKMYPTFYLNYGLHSHQNASSPLCLHGKPNYASHSH